MKLTRGYPAGLVRHRHALLNECRPDAPRQGTGASASAQRRARPTAISRLYPWHEHLLNRCPDRHDANRIWPQFFPLRASKLAPCRCARGATGSTGRGGRGSAPITSHQATSRAFKGASFIDGTRVAPLAPRALPALSRSSRNGLMMSIGIGKTTVEFCSAPISASVCK